MTKIEQDFLALVRAGLHGETPVDPALTAGEWDALLRLAERHKLLALTIDAAVATPSFRAAANCRPSSAPLRSAQNDGGTDAVPAHIETAFQQISGQVFQQIEFLNTVLALQARGLDPVCVKGPACRALYPKPLLRPSVDDDLLIPADEAPAYHAALLSLGLSPDDPAADPAAAWELSYHKPGSPLYIELHKQLFDPNSPAFARFNDEFSEALQHTIPLQVQDVTLRTLGPTEHLLFLVLHAFKHFLHSGFGLRIVADICLFARAHPEADPERVRAACAARRCERFLAAVFGIGEKALGIPAPPGFAALGVDEGPLLDDVLAAGLHGTQIDRLHSANITLGAVADQNEGRARSGGLAKTVFRPARELAGRYPWLRKRPWLLPLAWAARVGGYLGDYRRHRDQSPAASLRIGRERLRLLEQYEIIDRRSSAASGSDR